MNLITTFNKRVRLFVKFYCKILIFLISLEAEADDILYGDLESTGKSAELDMLKDALRKERTKTDQLREECDNLRSQIVSLVEDRAQLESNMISMYNTAILELKRKDRDITSLHSEIRQLKRR